VAIPSLAQSAGIAFFDTPIGPFPYVVPGTPIYYVVPGTPIYSTPHRPSSLRALRGAGHAYFHAPYAVPGTPIFPGTLIFRRLNPSAQPGTPLSPWIAVRAQVARSCHRCGSRLAWKQAITNSKSFSTTKKSM